MKEHRRAGDFSSRSPAFMVFLLIGLISETDGTGGMRIMRIAIVTGASSGLGREYVRQLGDKEKLDEIWAIARRKDRLDELLQLTSCPVRPFPMDLTDKAKLHEFSAVLEKEQPDAAVLVNAAGFGRIGMSDKISEKDNDDMIDLNCRAAVDMTSMVIPYMHKGGRILEICSTAAFQPIAALNVYAASKAFLQSYTKALHYEMLLTGIHVTAVCPYWIKDTEFIPQAKKIDNTGFRHFPFASRARTVVSWSLTDSSLNLWVSTPGPVCIAHRISAKFIPHFLMVPLLDLLRRI